MNFKRQIFIGIIIVLVGAAVIAFSSGEPSKPAAPSAPKPPQATQQLSSQSREKDTDDNLGAAAEAVKVLEELGER